MKPQCKQLFVVLLRLSERSDQAGALAAAHKAWLERGFADGVFLVAGSLAANAGGAILAHATSLTELSRRVSEDPFVANGVVTVDLHAIVPSRIDDRLAFLAS